MKKIVILSFLFTLLFALRAGAAEITDCEATVDERVLIVSGTTDEEAKVGVVICDSNGKMVYMNDCMAENNEFKFNMLITSEITQKYTINVGGEDIESVVRTAEFIVSDENRFLNFAIEGNRGKISGNSIKVEVPGNSLKNLIATFAVSEKATVWIGDTEQVSGVTENDFTSDVIYTVIAEDGSKKDYTIEVTRKKESSSGGGGGKSSGKLSGSSFEAIVPNTNIPEETKPHKNLIFKDFDESHWASEWIYYLYSKGIVSGVTENTFEPERNITREEFVKLIILALDIKPEKGETSFADVPSDAWYADYIFTAVKNGIVTGIDETAFGTGKNITREDMAVMLHRAFSESLFEATTEYTTFTDEAEISDYALNPVKTLYLSEIISGKPGGGFAPNDNATRAEAAKVIGKLLSIR